jgi:acyl-CoA thioesterase
MSDNKFDRDTSVRLVGEGLYEGRVDHDWWIERGPNGGYIAAIMLRALTESVADADRTPRSFTQHYLAPPVEGPVHLQTRIERAGRRVTFVSGRMLQEGRLLATSQAAFALPMPGVEFNDLVAPVVPPPESLEPLGPVVGMPDPPPFRERYDTRWAIGAPPMSGAPAAVTGGWIRPAEARPLDHLLIAALTDAWMPSVFSRLDERVGVPTVDLTIHFRATVDPADADEWCLVHFRSQMAADGFVEEDGEVWSRSGRLLAHSRQLAMLLPPPSN